MNNIYTIIALIFILTNSVSMASSGMDEGRDVRKSQVATNLDQPLNKAHTTAILQGDRLVIRELNKAQLLATRTLEKLNKQRVSTDKNKDLKQAGGLMAMTLDNMIVLQQSLIELKSTMPKTMREHAERNILQSEMSKQLNTYAVQLDKQATKYNDLVQRNKLENDDWVIVDTDSLENSIIDSE